MQVIRVHLLRRDQQTPRLLQDPELRLGPLPPPRRFFRLLFPRHIIIIHMIHVIISMVVGLLVNVQHDRRPQAHRRHERVVRGPVLVRHDPLPRAVLVDQDVVGRAVRRVREDAQRLEARGDDGRGQPGRERRGQQRVGLGERGGPALQAAVRELGPAREGHGCYLFVLNSFLYLV